MSSRDLDLDYLMAVIGSLQITRHLIRGEITISAPRRRMWPFAGAVIRRQSRGNNIVDTTSCDTVCEVSGRFVMSIYRPPSGRRKAIRRAGFLRGLESQRCD